MGPHTSVAAGTRIAVEAKASIADAADRAKNTCARDWILFDDTLGPVCGAFDPIAVKANRYVRIGFWIALIAVVSSWGCYFTLKASTSSTSPTRDALAGHSRLMCPL